MEQYPVDKSRTQLKKEDRNLQKLGERLLTLSEAQINRIDIPIELKEAVLEARNIRSNTARYRQIQYIGVLMRNVETLPLLKALEYIDAGLSLKSKSSSQSSIWFDSLISGDDSPIEEIMSQFPEADRQKLRQLIRNARKTQKNSKSLLSYIKTLTHD
jgi:ribosome-associated protein